MPNNLPDPETRKEMFLASAAGMPVEVPTPITREEMYLDAIAEGGGGGTADAYTKAETDALLSKKPGEITTGKQYVIDGQTVTAGFGAEVFNNLTSNKASGLFSHAEGLGTTASEFGSHAEGSSTTASGAQSHAEGAGTTASGGVSHAEGSGTTASGTNSHAEGDGTTASSANQHVQGKYNVEDANSTYAFIIGNGTSSSARHNAFAIDWNGLIYINGAATSVDVSQCITPTDYATQTTGGTIKAWTTTDGSDTILHLATQ